MIGGPHSISIIGRPSAPFHDRDLSGHSDAQGEIPLSTDSSFVRTGVFKPMVHATKPARFVGGLKVRVCLRAIRREKNNGGKGIGTTGGWKVYGKPGEPSDHCPKIC